MYDDDIIPGSNFIKNCIDCYTSKPGIYGINGCSRELDDDGIFKIYSWDRNNSTCINEVIYLCQYWFFPRCVLSAFWTEEVSNEHTLNRKIAEDMHLSAMANKYLELKSYVVPQPLDDTSMWGNIAGVEFGAEDFAIHKQPMYREGMQKMFNKLFFNIH